MDGSSKYDDPTLYTLISERQNYENGFNIQIQILKELETGIEMKRTIKNPCLGLNAEQIKNIQARSKWNRFGLGKKELNHLAGSKSNSIAPDTFIEYNMNYLDSKHNKGVIKKMLNDPYNTEKIKVRDDRLDTDKDLERFIYNIYNNIEYEDDKHEMMTYNNYKYMTSDYENVRDDVVLKPKKKKENEGNNMLARMRERRKGAFVPSFKRGEQGANQNKNNTGGSPFNDSGRFVPRHKRGRDSTSTNGSDREEFTVRISNLPDDPDFQEVVDWLKSHDVGRFKLILPKNKRTGGNNNYGFIKYYSKEFADACIEKIHRKSYDYNIINAEYAKPRS